MPFIAAGVVIFLFAAYYIASVVTRFRESSAAQEQTTRDLLNEMQEVRSQLEDTEKRIGASFVSMRSEQREALVSLGDLQAQRIREIGGLQRESLADMSRQLTGISRLNEEKLEALRGAVENKLAELQKNNDEKLEKMRVTVDEKLHETLEKRLGEAFASVSDRLEQVHRGLGEMKALTSDVGDLKKVLSNVKVRGIWGETQLRALLEQLLTPEQYSENVATRPGSAERVEFAISLPGAAEGESPVWLPVDSKFPLEDYQRLAEASEAGSKAAAEEARRAIKARVLSEAKDIRDKYLEPPYTTDFGIMYLPVEGLYAEVLQLDGLPEQLSREYRVVPSGPVTFAALLNSLQMGFRTLAIEKRSSEVWTLLGKVKTEFDKFGAVLEKTRQKLDQAGKELDSAGARSRAITRALKGVQELPDGEGQKDIFDETAD